MADHGWFRRRFVSTVGMVGVAVALAGATYASTVAAQSSTFERLEHLERRADRQERAAERLGRILRSTRRETRPDVEPEVVPERVRSRLTTRIARLLTSWETLYRRTERRQMTWRPGRGTEVRTLLGYAERRVLEERRALFRAAHWLDGPSGDVSGRHARRRAERTIQLAQHRAGADTRSAEKRDVVEDAKEGSDAGLEQELASSQKELESKLERLLEHETGRDFHRKKGTLTPPVGAEIAHGFGKKKQDRSMTYVRHTGLTYRVGAGTEVEAAAPGLVVYARRLEGYGRLAIVDHGDGYRSLYAHLRSIAVDEGEMIDQGSRVGRSGSSDSLDGPKLYFELRRGKTPVDPEPWFVRTGDGGE